MLWYGLTAWQRNSSLPWASISHSTASLETADGIGHPGLSSRRHGRMAVFDGSNVQVEL